MNTPSHCVCGSPFSTDHAMICCHYGVHHSDVHDLDKVCYDVAIERPLQLLSGEVIISATTNKQD